jgi:hypothetical protein
LSHGVAIILLIAYVAYLVFQLWTHAYLYKEPADPLPNSTVGPHRRNPHAPTDSLAGGNNVFRLPAWSSSSSSSSSSEAADEEGDEEEEVARLTTRAAMVLILVVTGIVGITSEWLVGSINGLATSNNIVRLLRLCVAQWLTFAGTESGMDRFDLAAFDRQRRRTRRSCVGFVEKQTYVSGGLQTIDEVENSRSVDSSLHWKVGKLFFHLLLRLNTLFEAQYRSHYSSCPS